MEFARLKSRLAPDSGPPARPFLARLARPGLGVLLAALAVELVDDGDGVVGRDADEDRPGAAVDAGLDDTGPHGAEQAAICEVAFMHEAPGLRAFARLAIKPFLSYALWLLAPIRGFSARSHSSKGC